MIDRYTQAWGARSKITPVAADRIALGSCAAIWLALVGMSVAALVALMDLSRGFHEAKGNPHTSSVLYAVITISALIILAAIPMLLRARRMTNDGPVARTAGSPARAAARPSAPMNIQSAQGTTERLTALRPTLSDAEVNRIWLRGTAALMSAMGAGLLAVATGTYAMAIGHAGFSWTAYGIAAAVTLVMPLIPWRQVRRLRGMLVA
jgi:hypothetical protein